MPKITLGNGKTFDIEGSETVLEGVIRGGAVLEYSCNNGRCGACKSAVIAGQSEAVSPELGLTEEERNAGVVLLCARKAISDLTVEVSDIDGATLPPKRILPCRIQALSRVGADVMHVTLRLPPNASFHYLPGQYINVAIRGGPSRSYSIANAPRLDGLLDLYIRFVPDGEMSLYWFSQAKVNDLLQLTGPLGVFIIRPSDEADMVMLATGTGIAPVKAILEELASRDETLRPRSIHLFWGGRKPEDIFWEPGEYGFQINFVPIMSRAHEAWDGARGYVQDAAISHGIDFSNAVVYACGSPVMINSARDQLTQAGLRPGNFYADAFVASSFSNGKRSS